MSGGTRLHTKSTVIYITLLFVFSISYISATLRTACLPVIGESEFCPNIGNDTKVCSNAGPTKGSQFTKEHFEYFVSTSWKEKICPDHPETAILFDSQQDYCNYGVCETDEDCPKFFFNRKLCFDYCIYCHTESTSKAEAKAFCKEGVEEGKVSEEGEHECWEGDWSFSPLEYVSDFLSAFVIIIFVLIAVSLFALIVMVLVRRKQLTTPAGALNSPESRSPRDYSEDDYFEEELELDDDDDDDDDGEEDDDDGNHGKMSYDNVFRNSLDEEEEDEGKNKKWYGKQKKNKSVRISFSDSRDHTVDLKDSKKRGSSEEDDIDFS